ncbi:MAG: DUF2333 family protein [Gammaproteobacteria bacterium]|nr:DUF2333 family protein [Gammaproteobacteria bacterium]
MLTGIRERWFGPEAARGPLTLVGMALAAYALAIVVLVYAFDREPDQFDVQAAARARVAALKAGEPVRGSVTTSTLIEVVDRMLDKPGGYLSNDAFPPGVVMDDIPSWEYGVLVQARDLAIAMRNDFGRSQTQSNEDPALVRADNELRISNDSWMFPAAESSYRHATRSLEDYLVRLGRTDASETQFYTRADNLRKYLEVVEKRLGDLSQRLSASVGQARVNTDLAGDVHAERATSVPSVVIVKTPWLEIDDVFYEARGSSWALLHMLRALEIDFGPVLEKKNALVSLRQIIRELESTQDTVWSPMILNGEGFGFVANHSLVMASYISRANAAVIDLRMLLERG